LIFLNIIEPQRHRGHREKHFSGKASHSLNSPLHSTADKVYLADAIDNTHVDNWVNKRGQAQKLDQKVINCISQNDRDVTKETASESSSGFLQGRCGCV
jgi:predicted GNAT family acetyltransferase